MSAGEHVDGDLGVSLSAAIASSAAAAVDLVEVALCADCSIVISNGDTSGLERPDEHLEAMERNGGGLLFVVTCTGEDHEGCEAFRWATCGACGRYEVGQYHAGVGWPAEPDPAPARPDPVPAGVACRHCPVVALDDLRCGDPCCSGCTHPPAAPEQAAGPAAAIAGGVR